MRQEFCQIVYFLHPYTQHILHFNNFKMLISEILSLWRLEKCPHKVTIYWYLLGTFGTQLNTRYTHTHTYIRTIFVSHNILCNASDHILAFDCTVALNCQNTSQTLYSDVKNVLFFYMIQFCL